ncbi:MAG: aromatic ring-hydroxylating dioxygenase subunit alpha [Lysobacteraceae bacterium]|nr:MAG: aromatic ring-hydroxylating dioxygenase subunit alpha [Xanthomonadaceae bacterium]
MSYLRNTWYVASWSSDLDVKPIGRRFLGEPVVLYRDEQGEPVALAGRCPHRFAPLGLGTVVGDAIECPYHGLRFGKGGECVLNPHGDIPKAAALRVYPVVERNGVIWIWMGDAAIADDSTIADTTFLADTEHYATVTGYLHVSANYQLVIDNLLDLTHASYIHRGDLSSDEFGGDHMTHRFQQEGGSIHSNYIFADVAPSPGLAVFWPHGRTDVRAFMHLTMASTLFLDFRMGEVGGDPDQGVFLPSLHLIVPETENTTHYFYALGRNVALDSAEVTAAVEALTQRAFTQEDEPMIRACQEMMGTTDLLSLNPVMLKSDVASVRARLLLAKLMREEQSGAATRADPAAVMALSA